MQYACRANTTGATDARCRAIVCPSLVRTAFFNLLAWQLPLVAPLPMVVATLLLCLLLLVVADALLLLLVGQNWNSNVSKIISLMLVLSFTTKYLR